MPRTIDRPLTEREDHFRAAWDQIGDPERVREVVARLAQAPRLDVYGAAELYDLAYPGYAGDSEYYLDKGRCGRVLYLGVGTGRIFAPLATLNPQATGIDNAAPMLARLRQQHPHLREAQLVEGDVVSASFPRATFDIVVAPYSFLQVIRPAELPPVLANVRRWLAPGGTFHADTFSPYLIPFRKKGLETGIRQIGTDTRIAIYVLYDHLRRSLTELAHVETAVGEHVLEMPLAYYFPHEIVTALSEAGFEGVTVHGGYDGEPFDPTENEVIVYQARAGGGSPMPTANGHSGSPRAADVVR